MKKPDQRSMQSDEFEDIPADPRTREEILQGCRDAIWTRLDRITKALIVQTLKKGSYLHARFLFDLVGLQRQEQEPREDGSLVKLLLEKLGEPSSETAPAGEHDGRCPAESQESGLHTIE